MKHTRMLLASAAVGLTAVAGVAQAEYPERPVEFVVPWPPGDIEDTITRMIAKAFQDETGVPTSTVNIKGGGGLIGATHVFTQPADGYTVGAFTANIISAHIIRGNAEYDRDEFEPLAVIIGYPMMLMSRSDAPYNDLAELADHAKSNGLSLGVFGLNGPPALQTMKMAETLGFEFESVTAFDETTCLMLINGEIDVTLGGGIFKPCMTSGEVKALAAYTTARIPIYPDVPTLEEQVPGISTPGWTGLFVRKDTPQEARDVISRIAKQVVESDEARAIAANTGAVVQWMPPEEAVPFMNSFYDRFVELLGS